MIGIGAGCAAGDSREAAYVILGGGDDSLVGMIFLNDTRVYGVPIGDPVTQAIESARGAHYGENQILEIADWVNRNRYRQRSNGEVRLY